VLQKIDRAKSDKFHEIPPPSIPQQALAVSLVLAATLVVLQVTPLFWRRPFYIDWVNHVWLVEYFTAYFRDNYSFPTTVDAQQSFGNPLPIFYGVFFYPLLSLASLVFGSDAATRIVCGALLVAPLLLYVAILNSFLRRLPYSILLSTAINGSVYQLTNLYNRSALTEFAAHQFLLMSIGLVLYGLTRSSRRASAALAAGFLFATIALGTHPITFFTFSLFVVPLLILAILSLRSEINLSQALRALGWLTCSAAVLAPWMINTFLKRDSLRITNIGRELGQPPGINYFPDSIDSIWGKIGFFSFDPRVLISGIGSTSTPFLDAPFAIGLMFAVAGAALFLTRKQVWFFGLPAASIVVTLAFFSISIGTSNQFLTALSGYAYRLLAPIQFAYRLSNTFSLALTTALIIGALAPHSTAGRISWAAKLALIGAVLSVVAAGQKLYTTYAEFQFYPKFLISQPALDATEPNNNVLTLDYEKYKKRLADHATYPETFLSLNDYATVGVPPLPKDIGGRSHIDVSISWTTPTEFDCSSLCVVRTNLLASALSSLVVDGRWVEAIFSTSTHRSAILVDRGIHTIQAVRIPSFATSAISASIWLLLIWISVCLLLTVSWPAQLFARRLRSRKYR
jgi:hypothetical protein